MCNILAIIIYILSIVLNDSWGFMSMAGVAAAYFWFFTRKASTQNTQLSAKYFERKKMIGFFVLIIVILEFFFSYYLRIYHRDIFDIGHFAIGGITIINSFVVALELFAVLFYYLFLRRQKVFFVDMHILIFCAIILLPFILRDMFNAGYDVLIHHNSYHPLECINLSYRALILASCIEELLYRGVIFDELLLYCKEPVATVIQSLLFTFVHSERWILLAESGDLSIAVNLTAVFTMGLLSAFLRCRTNSLLPGIMMHFALNAGVYDVFLAVF